MTSAASIDLMMLTDRPFDRSRFARRRETTIADVHLWIATAEDTVLAKLDWARLGGSDRQVEDAGAVLVACGDEIDVEYVDRWADELGVRELLERARRVS